VLILVGGVLGALTADRASADVVGQVGTDADRVDVFAGQVDANSVSTGRVDLTDTLINSGLGYGLTSAATPDTNPSDVSSSTFTSVARMSGGIAPVDEVPAGATLQANLIVQADSVPSGETATYAVSFLDREIGGGDGLRVPTQLEVQVTDAQNHESGWQDIQSEFVYTGAIQVLDLKAKVTSGTLSTATRNRQIVLLRWVVD
jgi:hypothetical protein